jgi:Ser/Thr protein kinase RdoA (MazF antagonist)
LTHPYEALTPDLMLEAVTAGGLVPDGHLLALNSYENRVLQIGIEDQAPMIGKFYRPERWSNAAILEEHALAAELAAEEIPVVAPWTAADGKTLLHHAGFRLAMFPRRGGRAPEPGDLDQLEWIGRFIGRIHLVGRSRPFAARPTIGVDDMGWPARDAVLDSPLLPLHLRDTYSEVSRQLLDGVASRLTHADTTWIRVHGDCHHGNILWTDAGPHFVDLDDCRTGPAIQDLWMLLNGHRSEQAMQLSAMLEGYSLFHDFDPRELALIEPLRSLRMLHYSGWLARRWTDPAFPAAFPWAESEHYWTQHVDDLRQQIEALDAPPLPIY